MLPPLFLRRVHHRREDIGVDHFADLARALVVMVLTMFFEGYKSNKIGMLISDLPVKNATISGREL